MSLRKSRYPRRLLRMLLGIGKRCWPGGCPRHPCRRIPAESNKVPFADDVALQWLNLGLAGCVSKRIEDWHTPSMEKGWRGVPLFAAPKKRRLGRDASVLFVRWMHPWAPSHRRIRTPLQIVPLQRPCFPGSWTTRSGNPLRCDTPPPLMRWSPWSPASKLASHSTRFVMGFSGANPCLRDGWIGCCISWLFPSGPGCGRAEPWPGMDWMVCVENGGL